MNAITPFLFEGECLFRSVAIDNEPWFVLGDACRALEIANVGNAAARLDEDEKNTIRRMDANGSRGNPNITVVNEAGLYRLIFSSRKPSAERFKRWLAHEVLPAIRKTGRYAMPGADNQPPTVPVEIARFVELLEAENALLRQEKRRRKAFTDAERETMLDLARQGWGFHRISRKLGRPKGSVSSFLARARKDGRL